MLPVTRKSLVRHLICLGILFICPDLRAQNIPAFPGAEGYGAHASGGRGGDVYYVTTVDRDGPGSLRYGIENAPSAGRTIVFAVSGFSNLNGIYLHMARPNITIAGQTAPGDGFALREGTLRVRAPNIVIRHLRLRNGRHADSLNVDETASNTMFDHIEMSLSNDENMSSFNQPPDKMTLQWSTNAWGMETHSAGGLWDVNRATAHHTLWAHNKTRNPKARPWGVLDWINNVTFDWDIGFILGDSPTPADWKANVIGNYFVSTSSKSRAFNSGRLDRNGNPNFSLYLDNNLLDGNANGILDGTDTGWNMVGTNSVVELNTPVPQTAGVPVTVDDPLTAYKKVVSSVGPLRLEANPNRPLRDEFAAILIDNLVEQRRHRVRGGALSGTGASNGGYGVLLSRDAPVDSDADGMPDYWENAVGLNPETASNNIPVPTADGVVVEPTFFPENTPAGYTSLEEYLHFKAIPHAALEKNTGANPTALEVDLRRYASGFANSPEFTIRNVVGGAVTQSGPGGALVTFVPTEDAIGRAKFDFKVEDSDGSVWTRQFGIAVTPDDLPPEPVSRVLIWKGGGRDSWTGSGRWEDPVEQSGATWQPGDIALFDDTGLSNVPVQGSVEVAAMTVDATQNYAFIDSGSLVGAIDFVKTGPGLALFANAGGNNFNKLSVREGSIEVFQGSNLGNGVLDFTGGVITSLYGPTSEYKFKNPLVVPEGSDVTLNLSPRMTLFGGGSGDGTLNLTVPATELEYLRLNGLWSDFSGTLNITGTVEDAKILTNFNGGGFDSLSQATVNLDNVDLGGRNYSGGSTLIIGALNGTSTSALGGAHYAGAMTYSIGGLHQDMVFDGSITNSLNPVTFDERTRFTKVGNGTLTLGGDSSHTGDTTVNGGALIVNGTLGETDVNVNGGALLGGTGEIGNPNPIAMNSNSRLSPGDETDAPGTLALGNGLTLDDGVRLQFNLSSDPESGNDRITLASGELALGTSGTKSLEINLLDGFLGEGTYGLITGGSNTTGQLRAIVPNLPTNTRQIISRVTSETIRFGLQVTGVSAELIWNGSLSTWSADTPLAWTNAGSSDRFYNLDAVVFDDSAAVGELAISGAVHPASVMVDNTDLAYAFGGSGSISGTGSLSKRGNGALTLSTDNSDFSGQIILEGGSLILENASAFGSGEVVLAGGTLVAPGGETTLNNKFILGGPGSIVIDSGDLTLTGELEGDSDLTLDIAAGRTVTLAGDTSRFGGRVIATGAGLLRFNNGNDEMGLKTGGLHLGDDAVVGNRSTGNVILGLPALSGAPTSLIRGSDENASAGSLCMLFVGSEGTDTDFGGTISDGYDGETLLQTVGLTKVGGGILTLSGENVYAGETRIEEGILRVGGAIRNRSQVQVAGGATLDLDGGLLEVNRLSLEEGSLVTGAGTLAGDLFNEGTLTGNLGGLFTIQGDAINHGTMRFTGSTDLVVEGTFENHGLLDFITGGDFAPANFINHGVVLDSSLVRVADFQRTDDTFTLKIQSHPGRDYQLQSTSDLGGEWEDIGTPQPGDGKELAFLDPAVDPSEAGTFYRVRVFP